MLLELLNGKNKQNTSDLKRKDEMQKCISISYRFILHCKKTGFVVEHDFIMATYLADRVVVFNGEPSIQAHASEYGNGRVLRHEMNFNV